MNRDRGRFDSAPTAETAGAPTHSPVAPPAARPLDLSQNFSERWLPRDLLDLALAAPLALWIWSLFLFIPMFLIFAGLRALGEEEEVAVPLAIFGGLAVLIDVGLLIWLPAFRSVTVDRDGLLLRRYAGPSKRVAWPRLTGVARASRREIFFRVWLWPGFPPRGSVACGSTLDQFRLEWLEHRPRHYYFAPGIPADFLEAVSRYRPDLTVALGTALTSARADAPTG